MRRSMVAVLLSTVALGAMLTACGDDGSPNSGAGLGSMSDHDMDEMDGHGEPTPVAADARRIEVDATSFEFDADEITVVAGEDVAIVLSSSDVLHDFTIDEIDVHVAADRGETAEGGLRADKPGAFTYYCSVAGHREAGMEGTLVVAES